MLKIIKPLLKDNRRYFFFKTSGKIFLVAIGIYLASIYYQIDFILYFSLFWGLYLLMFMVTFFANKFFELLN